MSPKRRTGVVGPMWGSSRSGRSHPRSFHGVGTQAWSEGREWGLEHMGSLGSRPHAPLIHADIGTGLPLHMGYTGELEH